MRSRHQQLQSARTFARLMDNQFSLFGIKFGIENIIGFVPGIGDFLSLCLSMYLIHIGLSMKLPRHLIRKMVTNVVLDTLVGTVPVAGDVFDIFYKANMKNLAILEKFAEEEVVEGEIIARS